MKQKDIVQLKEYDQLVKQNMEKSPVLLDCLKAFLVGGVICTVGEGVRMIGEKLLMLESDEVSAFTAIVMVFLGALLTGLGVYDQIYKFGGAGAAVPITGFSNSVVSPAMEFRREGLIMGTGAKMFSIAGPVLVYGIGGSVLAGLIYLAVR